MIGFIVLERDTGKRAWMRVDDIGAFSENETKVDKALVPCVTVHLRNNVSWHFPGITADQLIRLMASAMGQQVNVTDLAALGTPF